jgi:hypothetical protein
MSLPAVLIINETNAKHSSADEGLSVFRKCGEGGASSVLGSRPLIEETRNPALQTAVDTWSQRARHSPSGAAPQCSRG